MTSHILYSRRSGRRKLAAWQVQDAKARFSELLEITLKKGPQVVTRRGVEAAVLVPISRSAPAGGPAWPRSPHPPHRWLQCRGCGIPPPPVWHRPASPPFPPVPPTSP